MISKMHSGSFASWVWILFISLMPLSKLPHLLCLNFLIQQNGCGRYLVLLPLPSPSEFQFCSLLHFSLKELEENHSILPLSSLPQYLGHGNCIPSPRFSLHDRVLVKEANNGFWEAQKSLFFPGLSVCM